MDLEICEEKSELSESMEYHEDERNAILSEDKVRRNLLLAKKYMVESIYRSANVEGLGFTFPETQSICDGMSVEGHNIESIEAVVDLKRAWQWVFNNYDSKVDVSMLKTLSSISGKNTVINSGCLRDAYDEPIRVVLKDGKYYYPELPNEAEMELKMGAIMKTDDKLDAAFEMFCYVAKLQAFNDGNKRVATLVSNVIMIQNGCGILSIPKEQTKRFYEELTSYYETDDNRELKKFLKDFCYTKVAGK